MEINSDDHRNNIFSFKNFNPLKIFSIKMLITYTQVTKYIFKSLKSERLEPLHYFTNNQFSINIAFQVVLQRHLVKVLAPE